MAERNTSEFTKIICLTIILLFASIGVICSVQSYLGPKAVLTEQEKPPASMNLFVLDNEVWIRPVDINGQSTKYPGNIQVRLSKVKSNDQGGLTYTPIITNAAQITQFELVYINNKGNATNLYAATTGINLPASKGLYSIQATYYPRGQDYSLSTEIIRGVQI